METIYFTYILPLLEYVCSMRLPELQLDYPNFLVWNRFISKLDGRGNHFTLVEEEDNYTYVLQYIRNNN
jgi:hypothetical protein